MFKLRAVSNIILLRCIYIYILYIYKYIYIVGSTPREMFIGKIPVFFQSRDIPGTGGH